MEDEVIYIPYEDEYGVIVQRGAHASLVKYSSGGINYEVILLNEDFEEIEEN